MIELVGVTANACVQAVFAINRLALCACLSRPCRDSGRVPTGKGAQDGSGMVAHPRFSKEKGPGLSWVDLGREYGMMRAEARTKRGRNESAVAIFL